MTKSIPLLLLSALAFCSCTKKEGTPDYRIEFGKVARHSKFVSEDLSIWGAFGLALCGRHPR